MLSKLNGMKIVGCLLQINIIINRNRFPIRKLY